MLSVDRLIRLKREHNVKSVKELHDLGVINVVELNNYTKQDYYPDFEYDDTGLCVYKEDDRDNIYKNTRFRNNIMLNMNKKVYNTTHICNILSMPTYCLKTLVFYGDNEKEEVINEIFLLQDSIKKTIFTNKKNLAAVIAALDDGVQPSMVDVVFKGYTSLSNASFNKYFENLNQILCEYGIKHYCIYKELCKYSANARYEGCEEDMAFLDCIPDNVEFSPTQYKYLLINRNSEIVKHYVDIIDRDIFINSITGFADVTDAAYRHVWDMLDNSHLLCFRGLSNITNILHRIQIKYDLIGELHYGVLRDVRITLGEITEFLVGRNLYSFLFGGTDNSFKFRSAKSLRDRRIEDFTRVSVQYSTLYDYMFYKYYKHTCRSCVPSNELVRLIRIYNVDIINMILANHYCIIEDEILQIICKEETDNLLEIFMPYIPQELVKLHRCSKFDCKFKKFNIIRTKSAKR